MNFETQNDLFEAGVIPPEQDFKHDSGKVLWSCLSRGCAYALNQVAKVLTFGAKKYRRDTWRTLVDAETRYEDALDRHINAWKRGEDVDSESGLGHLEHAVCNLLFLIELVHSRQTTAPAIEHNEIDVPERYAYNWRVFWKERAGAQGCGPLVLNVEPCTLGNGDPGFRVKYTGINEAYCTADGESCHQDGRPDGCATFNLIPTDRSVGHVFPGGRS